jgi:hypothetical protein
MSDQPATWPPMLAILMMLPDPCGTMNRLACFMPASTPPACTAVCAAMTGRSTWIRWGIACAVVAMLAWVVGIALIPLDAKLDRGDQHLAATLAANSGRLYTAGLLAVVGAILLVVFFVMLALLVPADRPGGGLLRISVAGCVVTQTLVATGASFALVAVHAAVHHADPALAALAWRGLWLTFLTAAPPTILFTVTGVLGLDAAGLSPRWVSALGALSAVAHVLASVTVAQRGAFAPDGPVAAFVPVATVAWVLAIAATVRQRVIGVTR